MPKQLPTLLLYLCIGLFPRLAFSDLASGASAFHNQIRPILENYCFDCHADGANKGNIAFDEFKSDAAALQARELWLRAFKMLRAGLMPPANKPQPTPAQRSQITQWIKRDAFALDPQNPDPGRVTVRRLNRVEYHYTIKDLLGVDFDAESEFPPDDTGFGFDNIGDVLTLPPMLLEKYLAAATKIVAQALPKPGAGAQPLSARFFPAPIPTEPLARRQYASNVLARFATSAYRRPPETRTVQRLVGLAESVYTRQGETFESGIAQAMVAILASPRFLFREEALEPGGDKQRYPLLDEYSLASRLSYFLWSSMPDEELLNLAGQHRLRKELPAQVTRMLADPRAARFVKNFTGQWLRARDIETIPIEARFVLLRETKPDPERERRRERFHQLRDKPEGQLTSAEREELAGLRADFRRHQEEALPEELSGALRRAMRTETERVFGYVLHEDRNVLELIESDYTFLNERLARHYGLMNVDGEQMRLVKLPPGSPRGGVLTEGTVLVTTSNPTRTSPVKRGVFILDNILGTPVPPPPPNLPPLEDAARKVANAHPTLRETLAAHRDNPLCSSCHNRMDPLGLAFENFNALGMWRDSELGQPIDAAGRLLTGEAFSNVKELKRILVTKHAQDFYRTFAEKLLVYAVGRGLEYYDVETVDQLVARLEQAGGRPSALLAGIVDSAPFQRTRRVGNSGLPVLSLPSHKPAPHGQS